MSFDSPPDSWEAVFLDELIKLDATEQPHGLYGIRGAHAHGEKRLPTLAETLKSPKRTDFLRRAGFVIRTSRTGENRLAFETPSTRVEMRLFDFASTKVRHFGSTYRLDSHHGKVAAEPDLDWEKLIPKLAKPSYPSTLSSAHSILLLAHAPSLREIETTVVRAVESSFLQRYGVTLATRAWEDRYGRGFHSALYLWNRPERDS